MAINYTWHILRITSNNNENNKVDVVKEIRFKYQGVDSDTGIVKWVDGICELDEYVEGNSFIEFDNLTKENCIDWISEKYSIEDFENKILNKIELEKNPTQKITKPHWN